MGRYVLFVKLGFPPPASCQLSVEKDRNLKQKSCSWLSAVKDGWLSNLKKLTVCCLKYLDFSCGRKKDKYCKDAVGCQLSKIDICQIYKTLAVPCLRKLDVKCGIKLAVSSQRKMALFCRKTQDVSSRSQLKRQITARLKRLQLTDR